MKKIIQLITMILLVSEFGYTAALKELETEIDPEIVGTTWSFVNAEINVDTPTLTMNAANKGYVDSVAVSTTGTAYDSDRWLGMTSTATWKVYDSFGWLGMTSTATWKVYDSGKWDGLDSTTTFLSTATAVSTYLPLAGGTMTGNLTVDTTVYANVFVGDGSNIYNIGYATGIYLTQTCRADGNITRGQPVYISGNTGPFATVAVASNIDGDKDEAFGLSTQDRTNGQTTIVLISGILDNLDTSDMAAAAHFYLGEEILTDTIPSSGTVQHLGHVTRSHASNGTLQVHVESAEQYLAAGVGKDLDLRAGDGRAVVIEDGQDNHLVEFWPSSSTFNYKIVVGTVGTKAEYLYISSHTVIDGDIRNVSGSFNFKSESNFNFYLDTDNDNTSELRVWGGSGVEVLTISELGAIQCDSNIDTSGYVFTDDGKGYAMGNSQDAKLGFSVGGNDHVYLGLKVNSADYSGNFDIIEYGEATADLGHSIVTHPTLNIWTDGATDRLILYSSGTYAHIDASHPAGISIDNHTIINGDLGMGSNDINVGIIKATSSEGLSLQDDGGNEGIHIKDGGNVGIGTETPVYKLDVQGGAIRQQGSTDIDGYLLTNSGDLASHTNLNPGILVFHGTAGNDYGMDLGWNAGKFRTRIFTANATDIAFGKLNSPATAQSNFTEWMTIEAGGNVGIGTTTPSYLLEVNGGIHAVSSITADAGFYGAGPNLTEVKWNGISFDTSSLTAGDLIRYDETDFVSVASGTVAGQYLKQDYTWDTPSSGGDVLAASDNIFTGNNIFESTVTFTKNVVFSSSTKIRVNLGGVNQTGISSGEGVIVEFDTKVYDVLNEWNTTTYTFTARNAGYYHVYVQCEYTDAQVDKKEYARIYHKGVRVAQEAGITSNVNASNTANPSTIVYCVIGDTVTFKAATETGTKTLSGAIIDTFAYIFRIH